MQAAHKWHLAGHETNFDSVSIHCMEHHRAAKRFLSIFSSVNLRRYLAVQWFRATV